MTQRLPLRRTCLVAAALFALGLSGCGTTDDPPTAYAPLSYDYLTKLRLQVSSIEIDDSWAPRPGSRDVGFLAPTPPVDALRQMAQDRLVAGGPPGRAVFVIDDASLVQNRDLYQGRFVVHLDVVAADGSRSGYAEARVERTRAVGKDTPNATRAALADMVNQMMGDMNVELEYQVRHSLRAYLMGSAPIAPPPPPIQSETLAPPTGQPAPAAGQPTGLPPLAPQAPPPLAPAAPQPGPPPRLLSPPPGPLSPPPGPLTLPRGAPTPLQY